MTDQAPILVLAIPLLTAILMPLAGLFREKLCYPLVIMIMMVTTALSGAILFQTIHFGPIHYYIGDWRPPWGIELVIDPLNALVLLAISVSALLAAISSKAVVEKELEGKEIYFYTLFLLQMTGLTGMVITGDMFNLYVFLEITSITGYALLAVGEDGSYMAVFKYLVMGTIGASFYLIGVGYLYMATGSLNMADVASLIPGVIHSRIVFFAFILCVAGLFVKMAMFPVHGWLPGAYSKAPSAAAALIAPLTTKVSVYILIRICLSVFTAEYVFDFLKQTDFIVWLASATIVFGSLSALAQKNYKKMLTYILIAEVGYMVGGFFLGNRLGISGAILHIVNDVAMTLALFLGAGIFFWKTGSGEREDLKGLFVKMPLTMTGFALAAFSVIGVPPTCGFFSKWYLISGGIAGGQYLFVAALIFSSLINAVLFFRLFEIAYFQPFADHHHAPAHGAVAIEEAPIHMLAPFLVAGAILIALGLYSGEIVTQIIQFAIPAEIM